MQEFENGQEVEACSTITGWCKSTYLCTHGGYHLTDINGELSRLADRYIRPIKLICDEAREKILELVRFKARVESKEVYDYIEDNIAKSGTYLIDNTLVTPETVMRTDAERRFNETHLPELDLKTGKVIPCEGEKDNFNEEFARKVIADLRAKIEENNLKGAKSANYWNDQLKEKDAEISNLRQLKQINKDTITEQKRIMDGDLLARAEDKAVIKRLTKLNTDKHDKFKEIESILNNL